MTWREMSTLLSCPDVIHAMITCLAFSSQKHLQERVLVWHFDSMLGEIWAHPFRVPQSSVIFYLVVRLEGKHYEHTVGTYLLHSLNKWGITILWKWILQRLSYVFVFICLPWVEAVKHRDSHINAGFFLLFFVVITDRSRKKLCLIYFCENSPTLSLRTTY